MFFSEICQRGEEEECLYKLAALQTDENFIGRTSDEACQSEGPTLEFYKTF